MKGYIFISLRHLQDFNEALQLFKRKAWSAPHIILSALCSYSHTSPTLWSVGPGNFPGLVVPGQRAHSTFNRRPCHGGGRSRKPLHHSGVGDPVGTKDRKFSKERLRSLTLRRSVPLPRLPQSFSLLPEPRGISALLQEPTSLPGGASGQLCCPSVSAALAFAVSSHLVSSLAISCATAGPEGLSWVGFCRARHPSRQKHHLSSEASVHAKDCADVIISDISHL